MQQLGVIGLGTMGANFARNAMRNGTAVSIYNRTAQVTEKFLEEYWEEGKVKGCKSYKEFVQSLDAPRAILLMVKAGDAVEAVLRDLLPLLEKGDILIDGGNSHYPDTQRRTEELAKQGIHFIGMGISGGEEGALSGPSMMPGGNAKAYKTIAPLLTKMAADDGEGGKCISYIGEGGAGHFVKMVHNGIEYGIMQLLAESYALLKNAGGFSNEQLAETFAAWNDDADLSSFLLEITAKIFTKKDEGTGEDLIDLIADSAGQKGTGKWTTESAMRYGVAIPTINAAVDARILSGSARERKAAQEHYPVALDEQDPVPPAEKLRSVVRHALELSVICAYQQGFLLIQKANEEEQWGIDLGEVARIWRGGCIIRAALLMHFQAAFGAGAPRAKAAKESILGRFSGEQQLDWRRAVTYAASRGVAMPAMSASLSYFDALRSKKLPQNLIQAQRDFFGAHTFERTDKEGKFHADWQL